MPAPSGMFFSMLLLMFLFGVSVKSAGNSQSFTRNYEHKKRRVRLSLPDRFDQYAFYFQINFQASGGIFGRDDIIERAGDNTVAIAL